ncbi:hypothetical protein HRbin06_01066 [archaeon HR06]|nr:hypothetical protein HRbin06_01066 [archaeon HR06]
MEAIIALEPPRSWIKDILSNYSARIRILDCKALKDKEGVEEIFEIISEEENKILEELKKNKYLKEVEIISAKEGRILGAVKTKKCTACKTFALSNCFLLSASTDKDGLIEWTLLAKEDSLYKLIKDLEAQNIKFTIKRLVKVSGKNLLTARQEEILQIAFEKGYFDYPRSIDLKTLASQLDISPSTLSELLRKAIKKVLKERFKGKSSVLSRQIRL